MSSCSTIAISIILVLSRYSFFLFNQRFHREMFLLVSYYPTILVIMLVHFVPFFTSHHSNLIHLHYLHDIILHYSSLIRYLGYHQLSIHLILVILLHKILLMLHPHLTHRLCSITPDLKGLYSRILMIFPQSPTT